jgi:hypothetical protein
MKQTKKSLKWGSNPRPFAYEANALPLSYPGINAVAENSLNIMFIQWPSGLAND